MDHSSHLDLLLRIAHCGDPGGTLLLGAAFFLTGLAGGIGHCGPMCGPIVLMLVSPKDAGAGAFRRLALASLPYQLGRLVSYAGLGGAAGALGGAIVELTQFRWFLSGALLVGALLFFSRGLRDLVPRFAWLRRFVPVARGGSGASRLVRPLFASAGLRKLGFGIASGLLPCGFLYAALAAAAGSGAALEGAVGMAAFALGTMPSLLAVSLLGGGAALRWRRLGASLAAPLFLINGMTLLALALKTAS